MSIIVSNSQYCDEQQFQTLSCALYTFFLGNKARFSHTSTVTRLHSCSRKNTRTPSVYLVFYIEINIFKHFKTKYNK